MGRRTGRSSRGDEVEMGLWKELGWHKRKPPRGAEGKYWREKKRNYVTTDRGSLKCWPWVIWRAEDDKCECGIAQNAVHMVGCLLVGDGKGGRRRR